VSWFDALYRGDILLPGGDALRPPWELGAPQPAVIELADTNQIGNRVLDSGCGSGEHVAYLASRGHQMTGIDISAEAIRIARQRIIRMGLRAELRTGDVVQASRSLGPFDTVLDIGLFHLLTTHQREQYAVSLGRVCRVGATVHVVAAAQFAKPNELQTAFGPGWDFNDPEPAKLYGRVPNAEMAQHWYRTSPGPDGTVELPAWLLVIRRSDSGT
jgi:SAM-dependent methyltransferase